MQRTGSELENLAYQRILDSLGAKSGLILKVQDRWKTALLIRYFDIVIYKGENPFAVIEVKILPNKDLLARATDQVRSALTITNARFGVVTDNDTFYIYDRNKHENDFVKISFQEFIDTIKAPVKVKIQKKDKSIVASIILDAVNNMLAERAELNEFLNKSSLPSKY